MNFSRPINRIAEFLSTAVGFLSTLVALLVGIGIGALVQFSDSYMFIYNLWLSTLAIVISGGIGTFCPLIQPAITTPGAHSTPTLNCLSVRLSAEHHRLSGAGTATGVLSPSPPLSAIADMPKMLLTPRSSAALA